MTGDEAEMGDRALANGIALEVPGRFAWRVLEMLALPVVCYLVARAYETAASAMVLRGIPFYRYDSMKDVELAVVVSTAGSFVVPVALLFVLSVYLARLRHGLGLRELGWHMRCDRGAALKAAGVGIAGGLLWYAGMWWANQLPPELRYTGLIGPPLPYVWPTYTAIGAVLSASEETFFRGLLYRVLRARYAPLSAALLSSALFVVWHPQVVGRPPLAIPIFVAGLVYCDLFERSRSLVVSQAAHAALNVTGMILMNTV